MAINDIDKAAGQALQSQIQLDGGTSFYLHGDAASERDVSALMTAVGGCGQARNGTGRNNGSVSAWITDWLGEELFRYAKC